MAETEMSASRDQDVDNFFETRPRQDVRTSRDRDHNPGQWYGMSACCNAGPTDHQCRQ